MVQRKGETREEYLARRTAWRRARGVLPKGVSLIGKPKTRINPDGTRTVIVPLTREQSLARERARRRKERENNTEWAAKERAEVRAWHKRKKQKDQDWYKRRIAQLAFHRQLLIEYEHGTYVAQRNKSKKHSNEHRRHKHASDIDWRVNRRARKRARQLGLPLEGCIAFEYVTDAILALEQEIRKRRGPVRKGGHCRRMRLHRLEQG